MAKAHFGSKISPNMLRTPDDFLICYNVPIARTGVQKYLGEEIGLNDKAHDIINVYRTEDEVFNPKTIASFEGKLFTDEHPNDWVNPLNFQTYGKGAVTNVRRGKGQESDLLLADIIVYNQQQIDEIENKQKREISCGYECEYIPYKDGYKQKNIVGNHVALVSAGRAGNRVAIKDNQNRNLEESTKNNLTGGKKKLYKIPRRSKVSDFFQAVGLKHVAMDAEPEDILDAVNELVEEKAKEKECDEDTIPEVKSNNEKEEVQLTSDEIEDIKKSLSDTRDALYSLLTRDEEQEELIDDSDCQEGMESLDDFEEEMSKEGTEDDEVEEIQSAEKSPEEIDEMNRDEDIPESEVMKDSAIELVRALKPIIAYIPDKRERKRVSDNLAKVLRKQVRQAERKESNVYSNMVNNRPRKNFDSAMTNPQNMGAEIAKKYNPHYKEVK